MTEIQGFVLTLLSATSASVALSAAAVWLARDWIGERLKNSIKHEYDSRLAAINSELKIKADSQIEMFKATIGREADKIRFATSAVGEGNKAVVARKLDAVEALWKGALSARQNVPLVMGFIDILSVEDYMSMADNPDFKKLVGELSKEKISEMYRDNSGSIERFRPYVGEYLWAIFSANQAFVTRVVLLMQMGAKDPDKLNWHLDGGIRQLLVAVLTSDELKDFDSIRVGKVGWVLERFEAKILKAMQKVISGEAFGDEALRQAQNIDSRVLLLNDKKAVRAR